MSKALIIYLTGMAKHTKRLEESGYMPYNTIQEDSLKTTDPQLYRLLRKKHEAQQELDKYLLVRSEKKD